MIALAELRSREERCDAVCHFVAIDCPPVRVLPALDRTFDFGIVMGVMDHLLDAEFLAALRPRNLAIISFPGHHWLREPLRRYRYKLLGRCGLHNYDETAIPESCVRAGLSRTDVRRLDHSGICFMVTEHA